MTKIKSTHQAAYDYAMATIKQSAGEQMLDKALRTLGSDNQIIDLCEPILVSYRKLLTQTLGLELMDWLDWWMYETDYGKTNMEFSINNTSYDPTTMTLYRFLELVDENA
jgi:patatin-like phospholipase/acyl hydrolase